jgi:hypothetical protein
MLLSVVEGNVVTKSTELLQGGHRTYSAFSASVTPESVTVMRWLYSPSRSRNTFASNLHSEKDVTRAGIKSGREDETPHR